MSALFHDQEFWFAVAFVIFVAAVYRTAVKMLTGGLDSRAAKVRTELEEARRLREQAQAMLDEYRRKQDEAVETATQILAAAKDDAEAMRREGEEILKRTLAAREAQAMDRIAQAEQAAVAEVKARAVNIAIRAATGLIPQVLDQDRARALVDSAIDSLPRSGAA